jgi:DNA-binding CsgD family transcriptional regulator
VKDYSKVPWLKVNDYLLQVGSCRTISEFTLTACREAEKLIPFDAACFHRISLKARCFERCLDGICCSRTVMASYNDYYRTRQPGLLVEGGSLLDQDFRSFISTPVVDWRKFRRLEYASDFMLPNQMYKSLAHVFPAQQVVLSAHRSRFSPDFDDRDITILDLLNQHLNNYWPFLVEREGAKYGPSPGESRSQSVREKAARFGLTQREQEISLLLSERLSMPEIADRLCISCRTVEKHAENIYGKLGINKKQEVGERLFM